MRIFATSREPFVIAYVQELLKHWRSCWLYVTTPHRIRYVWPVAFVVHKLWVHHSRLRFDYGHLIVVVLYFRIHLCISLNLPMILLFIVLNFFFMCVVFNLVHSISSTKSCCFIDFMFSTFSTFLS
jgi:hypothetical protein